MSLADIPLMELAEVVADHQMEAELLERVRAQARTAYDVSEGLMDSAADFKYFGRFRQAHNHAMASLQANHLSTALMELCRAQARLRNSDNVKELARRYMLSVLPAVDALAILGRESP